jgi:hypothetical protein
MIHARFIVLVLVLLLELRRLETTDIAKTNPARAGLRFKISHAWVHIQTNLFIFPAEELGPPNENPRKLVAILERIRIGVNDPAQSVAGTDIVRRGLRMAWFGSRLEVQEGGAA